MKRIQGAWGILTGLLAPMLVGVGVGSAGGLMAGGEAGGGVRDGGGGVAGDLAVAGAGNAATSAVGVQWRDLSIEQAIAEAREKDTLVMVDVWDSHCGACLDLDAEVFQTADGGALADGLIPIKVQTTVDIGKAFMKLYPVTGLPAILLIKPDGTELDRVEGYSRGRVFFLDAMRPLRNGLDPLPTMEKKLQARPDSLPLLLGVMEKYLFRKRETEAMSIYQRIQKLDPKNARGSAERSMQMMARFEENWKVDYVKAYGYYTQMVERFPESPSAGGNADGAFKALYRIGRGAEWKDWICPVLEKNPTMGSLQRSAAMTAFVWYQRGECFAKAARRAAKLNVGKQQAYFDSIAVILEGGTATPGR
jgi:tetratricopeptide (TPR) repeat protein